MLGLLEVWLVYWEVSWISWKVCLRYWNAFFMFQCFDACNNSFAKGQIKFELLLYGILEEPIICSLCRYNTIFNLFWDITERVVKCICYLLFLLFFCYHLSIIVDAPKFLGVFLLMLITSLIPTQTLFSLFVLSLRKLL